MNKLINELIDRGMRNLMNESRDALARADESYQNDCKEADLLERQYKELDLTDEQRVLIHDYMACTASIGQRYADISYICGIKDTVGLLASLGLIKGVEVEE